MQSLSQMAQEVLGGPDLIYDVTNRNTWSNSFYSIIFSQTLELKGWASLVSKICFLSPLVSTPGHLSTKTVTGMPYTSHVKLSESFDGASLLDLEFHIKGGTGSLNE